MIPSIKLAFRVFLALLAITISSRAEDLVTIDLATLKKKADSGQLAAQVELAFRAIEGKIETFDENAVYKTFEKGAKNEIPRAFLCLGMCRHLGIGVRIDREKSMAYFKRAAELGDIDAKSIYGWTLFSNSNDNAESDRGLAIVKAARDAGSEGAANLLASQIINQEGSKPEAIQKAIQTLEHLAVEKRNIYAIDNLYEYYKKTGKNNLKLKYLKMGVEANSTSACIKLANIELANKGQGNEKYALTLLRKAVARGSNEAKYILARKLMRHTNKQLKGEDWYKMLLLAHEHGHSQSSFELGRINHHAAGYTFRDLDWKMSVECYEAFLEAYKNIPPASAYPQMHTAVHAICELHYKGGLGLKKDLQKCLESARPYLGVCEIATAHVGRVLLHPDTPLGTTRQARINGYACMLRAKKGGYKISEDTLFIMRSRFSLTREEVAAAKKLIESGFPKHDSTLLE